MLERCCSANGGCISRHASWRSAVSLHDRRLLYAAGRMRGLWDQIDRQAQIAALDILARLIAHTRGKLSAGDER